MARNKPGDQERLRRQIMANRMQQAKMRTMNYKPMPFTCTNEVETETVRGVEKRICGCTLFDLKIIYTLCGCIYGPEDWKKAIRE